MATPYTGPGQGPIEVTGHYGPREISSSGGGSQFSQGISLSSSNQASQGANFAQTYIPEYSQTPILESIAKQAQAMAPEVYAWGMNQYNKNQSNIDAMMRSAMTYASPERIATRMGQAQAGVMQAGEAARQGAIRELESFGIDPSSGRYAALDQASRVMTGAAAAGAGNVAREQTEATGGQMQQAAQGASAQNFQTGFGAANAATGLLGVASQLKYSPLGQTSGGTTQSAGTSSSAQQNISTGTTGGQNRIVNWAQGGSIPDDDFGGEEPTEGGFVSNELSPSGGSRVDDVQARLNSGEFVIPKDVAAWKGQEFFYKLMAQSRKMRAMASSEMGGDGGEGGATEGQATGYAMGGGVTGGMNIPSSGGGMSQPARGTVVTPPSGGGTQGMTLDPSQMSVLNQLRGGGGGLPAMDQLPQQNYRPTGYGGYYDYAYGAQ